MDSESQEKPEVETTPATEVDFPAKTDESAQAAPAAEETKVWSEFVAIDCNGPYCHMDRRRRKKRSSKPDLVAEFLAVLPACYTAGCTCNFLESLVVRLPKSVGETAVYTKSDGIVDWHVCRTGNPDVDFEVSATHIGLAFNPIVFDVVAHRLAGKTPSWGNRA